MEDIGGLHPLQNLDVTEQILELIFKKLTLTDMKKCRLVCRAWLNASPQAMRSCALVRINNTCEDSFEGENDREGYLKTSEDRRILRFIELIKSDDSTFFRIPFTDTFEIYKNVMGISTFWGLCGHSIKSLILENFQFDSVDNVRNALLYSCPNLKEIKLRNVTIKECGFQTAEYNIYEKLQFLNSNLKSLEFSSYSENIMGISWIEIFRHFPSLQNMNISNIEFGSEEIFKSLATVRKHDSKILNLKKLAFLLVQNESSTDTERALVDGKLELEELHIDAIESDDDVGTVQRILAAHTKSLQSLTLKSYNSYAWNLLPLPNNEILHNLKELRIMTKYELISMKFLSSVPNLKTLRLSVPRIPKVEGPEQLVHRSCKIVVLNVEENLEVEDIQRLANLLPNVEELGIKNFDSKTLDELCECWPNLSRLKTPEYILSFGVSGMKKHSVEAIDRDWEWDMESKWLHLKELLIMTLRSYFFFPADYAHPPLLEYKMPHFPDYEILGLPSVTGTIWKWIKSKFL